MNKMTAAERQAKIAELLADRGTMRTVDIAEYFQVSRETIRRDLMAMSETGTVKKWFGSVMPVNDFNILPVDTRVMDSPDAKLAICQKALEFISPNTVLFLDTGSTVLCMAKLLKVRTGYTIITNSLPVVMELIDSNNNLLFTGGSVNSQIRCTTGMQTIEFLEKVKMDIAILGSSGFDRHKGPTGNSFEDSQIKRIALQNAKCSIVVADSSKASYSSLTQYAGWRDIDYLITDDGFPAETMRSLSEMTTVILAETPSTDRKPTSCNGNIEGSNV